MKLFELTENTKQKYGRTLTQIRAIVNFNDVKVGDLGGWIENESSLRDGCWAYEDALVFKEASIRGGVIRGGDIRGGEIRREKHIGFSNVGSENGYLFAYLDDDTIMISRGCYHGSIDEFYDDVEEAHGDNEHGIFYKSLRPIIELKLNKFIKKGAKKC